MERLSLEPTKYTPEIDFDPEARRLVIRGRSYPENTSEFYAPVFEWLEAYLEEATDDDVTVNIELDYFNSSSSKALMDFCDILEDAADAGKRITVNWIYAADDEDMADMGQEFQEDFDRITFNLVERED